MSITDELRLFAADPYTGWVPTDKQQADLRAIADRIDAEHEADVSTACRLAAGLDDDALAKRGYIALPVDADGVPIRVGDEMAFIGRMTVDATDGHNVFFFADNWADGVYCVRADELRHYRAPTVEDVLDEFANAVLGCDNTEDSVQRVIAEYAARLRLAGSDD